jgi:hypothetical protein
MKQQFSATEALTIARVMCALERQVSYAWDEGRRQDALSLAELVGRLQARIFGPLAASPLDSWYQEEAA